VFAVYSVVHVAMAGAREFSAETREKMRASQRRWREARRASGFIPATQAERDRRCYLKDPEKAKARSRAYKERIRQAQKGRV